MEKFWLLAGNVALIAAATITTALVIIYSFTRFETSQVGRQFWLTKASLAAILDFAAANLAIVGSPKYTSVTPIRVIIYTVVAFVMLRWLLIIVKTQRGVRRKRHPVWDAPETPPPVRSE